MNTDKLLGAVFGPILLLAVVGLLLGKCSGEPACPVDPLTNKEICSKYSDHEAWSRATASEME